MLCIGVGLLVVREKCGRIDSPAHTPKGCVGSIDDMFSCYYERKETSCGIYYINKCSRGKLGKNIIPKRDQAIRVSYHFFLIKKEEIKAIFYLHFCLHEKYVLGLCNTTLLTMDC